MVTMGTTKIVCRMCGTSATVKNEDLEAMREHRCANCNTKMTDMQMVNMKAAYFLRLSNAYRNAFGSGVDLFDFETEIKPQYTPDWAISAGNGSDTGGGVTYGKETYR